MHDFGDLQGWRDIFIIVASILMSLAFVAILLVTIVLGLAGRATLGATRNLIKSEVTPLLDNVNQTVHSVRGTTAFISETAVTPIIRVYGIVAGARRAIAVLGGVVSKRQRK